MGRDLDPSHGAQGLAISGETSLKAVRDAIASVLVSRGNFRRLRDGTVDIYCIVLEASVIPFNLLNSRLQANG